MFFPIHFSILRIVRNCKYIVLFIVIFLFFLNQTKAQEQTQQVSAGNSTQKIAYIDHLRLRREYMDLKIHRDSIQKEWHAVLKKKNQEETDKKAWHQKASAATQKFEEKIRKAISEVVAKEGFADVKPMPNDISALGVTDITDRVLQLLNTKNNL